MNLPTVQGGAKPPVYVSLLHELEVGILLPWAPAKNPAGGSVASLDRSSGTMVAKESIGVANKHATLV